MFVSVQIWPQVKAANPHLSSVTEIGAVVGAMWRDLDPMEKQRYNDQFNKEKVTLRNGIGFSSCCVFKQYLLYNLISCKCCVADKPVVILGYISLDIGAKEKNVKCWDTVSCAPGLASGP